MRIHQLEDLESSCENVSAMFCAGFLGCDMHNLSHNNMAL